MEVLVEVLPDDRVAVDADADLLQESVDVSVETRLSTFLHDDESASSVLNVVFDVLKLSTSEGLLGASKQEQLCAR